MSTRQLFKDAKIRFILIILWMYSKGFLPSLLSLLVVVSINECNGLQSFQITVTDKSGPFDVGQAHCGSLGMTLLRISNDDDNALAFAHVKARGVGQFFVDGTNIAGGAWLNSDGKELQYFKWHKGEPNNFGGHENCIHVGFFGDDSWNDISCGTSQRIVCQNNDVDPNAGAAIDTPNFQLVPQTTKMNYANAVDHCNNLGMELVKVDSHWMNKYVFRFAKRHNIGWYWINLNDIDKEGHWVTSDGEEIKYRNWANGEPNGGRGENCLHGNRYPAGKWNDVSCDSLNAVICLRLTKTPAE